jgi:hypothetical protein
VPATSEPLEYFVVRNRLACEGGHDNSSKDGEHRGDQTLPEAGTKRLPVKEPLRELESWRVQWQKRTDRKNQKPLSAPRCDGCTYGLFFWGAGEPLTLFLCSWYGTFAVARNS